MLLCVFLQWNDYVFTVCGLPAHGFCVSSQKEIVIYLLTKKNKQAR
jgi:dTDP-4-dehydrorhamnose 3,5-epimerase-like enzyme